MRWFTMLFCVLCVAACTAQNPSTCQVKYEIDQIDDVVYYQGEEAHPKHKLNLHIPNGVDSPPVMVWIHGGAWAFGGRRLDAGLANGLAECGIAVASISYRLSPAMWADPPKEGGIQHPEHIEDVARAVGFVYENASQYGLDDNNIFVSGYSAGGHLSALLALNDQYLNEVGLQVNQLRGAIPIAGAYDILAYYNAHKGYRGQKFADQHVKGVFGETEEQLVDASVTNWVKDSPIPMWVISESESYDYTREFEKKVEETKASNIEFWHIREETHKSLADNLNAPKSAYRDEIVKFIERQMI